MGHEIVRPFRAADVDLHLLRGPLRNVNPEVFQMDILRSRARECIRIWPGGRENRLRVTSIDPQIRQLVLLVKEPVRTFTRTVEKVRRVGGRILRNRLRGDERVLRNDDDHWVVERRTDGALRRFLCGRDESHLFVAQFREGESVREAHESLRPPEVDKAPAGTIRQGEWFFLPLREEEAASLEWAVGAEGPVGPGARPHVADEVVIRHRRVYARGAVRHPSHPTIRFGSWRRVVRNREVTAQLIGDNGVFWID